MPETVVGQGSHNVHDAGDTQLVRRQHFAVAVALRVIKLRTVYAPEGKGLVTVTRRQVAHVANGGS